MMRSSHFASDSLTRFACLVLSYVFLVTSLSPLARSGVRAATVLAEEKAPTTSVAVNAARMNGAMPSPSPQQGRVEDSPDAAAGNNDAPQGSSGGGLATGMSGQGERASGRAPLRGRPSSNLPDLDVTRRHQPTRPRAPQPIRSTRRNCPPRNPRCNDEGKSASSFTPTPALSASADQAAPYVEVAAAMNTGTQEDGGYLSGVPTFASARRDGHSYSISDAPFGLSWVARSLNSGTGLFPAMTSTTAGAFQGDAAAFVSQSVPAPMIAGQTYHVWITMRNTGATTWSAENSYRLGSENTRDNTKWRLNRVQLPAIVPPGAEVTIDFDVTAPLDTGTHDFQWRIVQDGPAGWFGEATANIPVSVVAPQYNGALEVSSCDYISGWASDSTRPKTPIQVDIFADDKFVARTLADQYHRNSTIKGSGGKGAGGSDYNGFVVQTPASLFDSRTHKITVRVANTLFMSGGSPYLAGSTKGVMCAPRPAATPNNIMNAVPGIIQAEDFDQGTNGVAYYDGSPGNYGAVYRTTDVDIEGCPDGSCGYWLSWVHDGEWTKYTINVTAAGTYTIETAVASTRSDGSGIDGSFRIEIDGTDVTGAITVGDTGGVWQAKPKSGIQLTAGQHIMKVIGNIATGPNSTWWAGKLDRFQFIRSGDSAGAARTPYSGVAAVIPGSVQAEDFDRGANGVAYYDGSPGNYGAVYRTASDDWVDIEGCPDGSCGYWLNWVHNGEWTEYTINVAATGDYNVVADVASTYSATYADGSFRIEVDGVVKATGLSVPNTGGAWHTTDSVMMNLTAGQHVMRVVGISGITGWAGKLDRIRFTSVGDTTGNGFSRARLKESNRTGGGGVDLLSGNFNWDVPLVSLPGRAGLDLGLSLSYNSLVWTKDGNAIQFNSDNGYPAPGFRLGFPTIQQRYRSAQTQRYAYLMITPSGSRVELRQVGASNVYESADSSYLQLIDYGAGLLLRATDGTQLTFRQLGGEFQCTQVKDRNGNFITVEYDSQGGLSRVKDTLSRVITFHYDEHHNLLSITQDWNRQPHTWATFGYATKEFISPFAGLTVLGPQNNGLVSVLSQVGLADGSSYRFDYTSTLQVSAIRRYSADNHQLAYTAYNVSAGGEDCPRVTARKDWALDWNNGNEAVTDYLRAGDGSWGQMTAPDGTLYKEFFATSGWQRGLTTRTEVWAGGALKKWTTTLWTQDDINAAYQLNPRPDDMNIHDAEGNHKRTTISYTSYGLPFEVKEYAADGWTVLRRSLTHYNLDAAFVNRHIIGLPGTRFLYEGEHTLLSKTDFHYDWGDEYFTGQTPSVQHDTGNYPANYIIGRGNLTAVRRFNKDAPDDPNQAVWQQLTGYNAAGSPVFTRDANWHTTQIDYTDVNPQGNNKLNTLAYPTKVTDAGGFSSKVRYDYDMGVATHKQGVSPDATRFAEGAVQTFAYDAAGRLERTTNTVNGAYTRLVYAPGQNWVQSFTTLRDTQTESYAIQILDGAGRAYAQAGELPAGAGGYSGRHTVYDVMGRAVRSSNPTEMNNGWEAAGDDAAGWRYSTQDYDWQGRPTYSTHPGGGMNQELIYGGCGCAGGAVVTARDARGRRQRMTSDVLGRLWKSEVYDSNGNVYSTTTNTYNARDQIIEIKEQAGESGAAQQTVMTYDGHGRLLTRKTPVQTSATVYAYHADDTLHQVTDARGVVETTHYDSRHLVTGRTYNEVEGVERVPDAWYGYDGAGNRTWMLDGVGRVDYVYDQLSRLTSETRQFDGAGSFPLTYSYTAGGQVASVTDWTGSRINYGYDHIGRLNLVNTPTPYADNVTTYASNFQYRAWGALKQMTYGSGRVLAQGYNARLQLSRFEIGGATPQGAPQAMATDYSYYDDGRIKFVNDHTDDRFDRAYAYDHEGRLSRGLSGVEARLFVGQPAGDGAQGPYSQIYSYDVWDNLTAKTGLHWSEYQTFTASYTDDRRAGWSYDAAGNVLSDDSRYGRKYTYDSAGRKAVATEQQRRGGGRTTLVETHLTLRRSADGDGRRARREEQKVTRFNNNAPQTTVETTYYVRSSVLGSVVAEVNSQGQRVKGYVYANGQMLVKQWGGYLYWQQANPVTGSTQSEATSGYLYADEESAEVDPLGNDVGRTDPYAQDGLADYGGSYEIRGNAFDESGGGCAWPDSQVPAPCSVIAFAINSGYLSNPEGGRGFNELGNSIPLYRYSNNRTDEISYWFRFDNAAEYADSVDSWRSPLWVGGRGPNSEGALADGRFAHVSQNSSQERDVPKFYNQIFSCDKDAKALMRDLQTDFSKFGNYEGEFSTLLGPNTGYAKVLFESTFRSGGSAQVTQGSDIRIRSAQMIGGVVTQSINVSVRVGSVSSTSFSFEALPGHVLYPATISFTANDFTMNLLGKRVQRVSFSVNVNGDFAGLAERGAYYAGGFSLENRIWNNLINNVRKSCGR